MATVLEKSVSKASDGTWGFQCPGVREDPCEGTDGVPFKSTEWPTKAAALARGGQHFESHRLGAEVLAAVREALADAAAAGKDAESVDRAGIAASVMKKSKHKPMQELHDFRVEQGLVVNDDGSVSVKDL